jgi:hypothetical protein
LTIKIEFFSFVGWVIAPSLSLSPKSLQLQLRRWRLGLNPKNETLDKGTPSRETNCEWQRNEWGSNGRSSVAWLSSG